MTTGHARATEHRRSPVQVIVIGAIGGAIAGMMLAAVEMIYGWLSDTNTFWDAPMAIWAWVAGIDNFGPPGEHVASIILGIVGHMMMSMMIGVVFAALMTYLIRTKDVISPVLIGVLYGLLVWVVMRYLILPINSGEAELFTTDRVSPQWVWWLSHAVLGMTAGIYLVVVRRAFGRHPE
ncbi:hypothetical protein [Haloechinothrix halophila]|uniref:hypothetical protein n=1 Tax=Haloechinothrix halophila TaxID=1069073 RepID=UPI0003FE4E5F|nr:hypothetical protein [Haloechinothrix halophila]